MTTDRAIRASDHDREHVVEILRAQYAEGRLTLEEFDERMAAAYAGKTWGDLLDLTNDLPADVRLGADLAAGTQAGRGQLPADQRPPQRPSTLLPLRWVPLVPLLLAGVVLASIASGGMGYPVTTPLRVVLSHLAACDGLFFLRRGVYGHRGRRGPFR